MKSGARLVSTLALALLLGVVGPVSAALWTTGIDDDGTVYVVRVEDAAARLLLDVRPAEGEPFTLVVPQTEGPETEMAPSLTVEGGAAYLVWSARRTIHSSLYLTSWEAGTGWSEVIEFSGDPFSTKVNPKIAVTRDRFLTPDEAESPTERQRAVIHLSWWDEGGLGNRPLYLPLSVVDGKLQPFEKPLDLYSWAGEGFEGTSSTIHPLAKIIALEATDRGVRIGFSNPDADRYGVVDVTVPAGSLEFLADEARAQVIVWGREHPNATRTELATHMHQFTYSLGREVLAEDVAAYIAAQVSKSISEFPNGGPIESLGDEARAQIVIWGSRIHGGIRQLHQEARAQVIIWGRRDQAEGRASVSLLTRFGDRALSGLPGDREIRPFLGPDRVILAWAAGEHLLRYVEIDEIGSAQPAPAVHALSLSGGFTREAAYESLERRASRR